MKQLPNKTLVIACCAALRTFGFVWIVKVRTASKNFKELLSFHCEYSCALNTTDRQMMMVRMMFISGESTNLAIKSNKILAVSLNFLRNTGSGTDLMPMLSNMRAAWMSESSLAFSIVSINAKKYSVLDSVPPFSLMISVSAARIANISF